MRKRVRTIGDAEKNLGTVVSRNFAEEFSMIGFLDDY
jgi:hypothetical protein|tara:strand:+ start:159 stop:269 length:111 start_codon:yes stop_codon:yes gene_type:complete